jgi:hypothetical protein
MMLRESIEHESGPRRPCAPLETAALSAVGASSFGLEILPTDKQSRILSQTWSFGHRLFPGETLEQSESS